MAQVHQVSGTGSMDDVARRIIRETYQDWSSTADEDRDGPDGQESRAAFDYWVGVVENDITVFKNATYRMANRSRGPVPVGAPESELDDRMAARDALWERVVDFLEGFVQDCRSAGYENWSRSARGPIRRKTPRAPQYRTA